MEIGIWITLCGIIVWAIRLEGKVISQEKLFQHFCENVEKSFEHIDNNIGKIFERVDRISENVSALEGYQKGKKNGKKNCD